MVAAHALFWGALGVLWYAYLGYPLSLWLLTLIRRSSRIEADPSHRPRVTVVLAAWNEEDVIAEKIENTLGQSYPPELLDLIVVSDGSTDNTDSIVGRYADTNRVHLLHTEGRCGKSVAVNVGVAAASGDVIVLTDANAMFESEAISRLVTPLANPRVGAVSGQLRYRSGIGTEETEGSYWRYEQVVKQLESRLDRLLGANGSIYAVRRELYCPLRPKDVSDFRIPYDALLHGFAVILEPGSVSVENAAPNLWAEYRRKVRIMARAIPMMFRLIPMTLARRRVFTLWQLVSHKVVREIQAVFFGAMVVGAASGAALGSQVLTFMLAAQALVYLLGIIGWSLPAAARWRVLLLLAHFDMIVLASFAALGLNLIGRVSATWQRAGSSGTST